MHNRRWVGRNRGNNLKSTLKVTLTHNLSTVIYSRSEKVGILPIPGVTLTLSEWPLRRRLPRRNDLPDRAIGRFLHSITRSAALSALFLVLTPIQSSFGAMDPFRAGPIYDQFDLTLSPGH